MRRPGALLAALLLAVMFAGVAGAERRIPGASAVKVCAGAGAFWPTETLAFHGSLAWVACKEQSRVTRVNTRTRRSVSVRLDAPVLAVVSGFGSIWALDSSSTLYRIAPASARVVKRIQLGAGKPYNAWVGGGSVWVVDDGSGEVLRVAPATGRVVARLQVGDGPADLAFDASNAYVINHRDRGLARIALATNAVTHVATIPGDAPERMALLGGRLWITGRGTDLLEVDPATGAVEATVDIGASGIDVVAARGALWVPSRSAAVDPSGFPTMQALRRVSASTRAVTTVVRPTSRVDVHGLDPAGGFVWLADNRDGVLYRVKA